MPPIASSGSASTMPSRGRSASYADVAAFEANLHGAQVVQFGPSCPQEVSHVCVSNLIMVLLDSETIDNILGVADELSSFVAIFKFHDFWPSLSNLHAWISKHWEPI